ncbi:hypothetical protein UVI_02056680 [Ustilaginoidea virens]|uniref:Uncharacterized protein n=1 Tax=Ustilaginoidea virens TaxID=1159556 RepID=A0A1B5KWK9_USTVR|nr:hypothetical protein UVI_02056680 [Ustilaginoidea virens]
MSWLGVAPFKKFPAPFPDEWKNDPRNPKAKTGGH